MPTSENEESYKLEEERGAAEEFKKKNIKEGEPLKAIKLKNGSEEVEILVVVIMLRLQRLFNDNPIHFYEFVERCRDDNHRFFGNTQEYLA